MLDPVTMLERENYMVSNEVANARYSGGSGVEL